MLRDLYLHHCTRTPIEIGGHTTDVLQSHGPVEASSHTSVRVLSHHRHGRHLPRRKRVEYSHAVTVRLQEHTVLFIVLKSAPSPRL